MTNAIVFPSARTARTVLVLALWLGVVTQAHAWWNDGWEHRLKVSFDTSDTGVATVGPVANLPLLVRLHSGNFDFTQTMLAGEDLRFVAGDDATPLPYDIELYDALDEIAFVWVKVPQLPAGTKAGFVWLYYGNDEATGSAESGAVFDAAQAVLFHFNAVEGAPVDATANPRPVVHFSGWQGAPGLIGEGVSFNGIGDRMVFSAAPPLDFSHGFTFSVWEKVDKPVADGYLLSMGQGAQAVVVGVDGTRVYCRVGGGAAVAEVGGDLPATGWHQLVVVLDPGKRLELFVDGALVGAEAVDARLGAISGEVSIGGVVGGHAFAGTLDEVGIATVARSVDWVRAVYGAEGPGGTLVSIGAPEAGGGSGLAISYLTTITGNISVDGWAIIGVLGILAVWSWAIFASKAIVLMLTERANRSFQEDFSALDDLVALEEQRDVYENSTLFRVYARGCQTLRRFLDNGRMETITDNAMNTFKTTLEQGFMQESQRINAQLVVMTMAITGGPFLGLLGTVWGVMNTFAAMAEMGEANIMAIAPGVASALATTVVGLLVAIPALFTYNYLTGKIKNLTAEMTIFIHQFALRVDELHGEHR